MENGDVESQVAGRGALSSDLAIDAEVDLCLADSGAMQIITRSIQKDCNTKIAGVFRAAKKARELDGYQGGDEGGA